MPSDAAIESALRAHITRAFEQEDEDALTVKRVRRAVEEALGLDEGFFKSDPDWRGRSKDVIEDEVEVQTNRQDAAPTVEEMKSVGKGKKGRKSELDESPQPKKRQKRSPPTAMATSAATAAATKQEVTKAKVKDPSERASSSPLSDAPDQDNGAISTPKEEDGDGVAGDESDNSSELSVLIDEAPKKRQRKGSKKSSTESPAKSSKSKAKPGKSKSKNETDDPDDAEIKRLQGWLVKCGIRKMWFRELAPYETPKAKIKHLRDMLAEAGMEGRYSVDKARQIKEKRELMDDLEAVKEGDELWGHKSDEGEAEEETVVQPRKSARARLGLDFLDDDEGEETD